MKAYYLGVAALAMSLPVQAQMPLSMTEARNPTVPPVLPLRDQAALRDAWLAERLDSVVPKLMRENGIDMWVLVAREYMEDTVVATMLDAESMHARRRTILMFYDPGNGKPIERLTVSRYGLGTLFAAAWTPETQPDQWKRLAQLIAERNPKKIGLNISPRTAFGDGLTHGQYQDLVAALNSARGSCPPNRWRSAGSKPASPPK